MATVRGHTDPTSVGLTELSKVLFGEGAISSLKHKGYPIRNIWEISDPTTQCRNVIGKVGAGSKCWICGLSIVESKSHTGFQPECEHILPIAQAVFFLSLYKTNSSTEADDRVMHTLEYAWAHNVCNQEKSDICPLIPGADKNSITIRNASIITMLRKIYDSNRSIKFTTELRRVYPRFDTFMNSRLGPIREKYDNITRFINGKNDNRYKLCILAGVISALDYNNIKDDVQDIVNPEARALQENVARQMERELNDSIRNDIRTQLGLNTADRIHSLEQAADIYKIASDHTQGTFQGLLKRILVNIVRPDTIKDINTIFDTLILTPEGAISIKIEEWIQEIIDDNSKFILSVYHEAFTEIARKMIRYNPKIAKVVTIKQICDFLIVNASRYLYISANEIATFPRLLKNKFRVIEEWFDNLYPGKISIFNSRYAGFLEEEGKSGFMQFIKNIQSYRKNSARMSALFYAAKRDRNLENNENGEPNASASSKKRRLTEKTGGYRKSKSKSYTRRRSLRRK